MKAKNLSEKTHFICFMNSELMMCLVEGLKEAKTLFDMSIQQRKKGQIR